MSPPLVCCAVFYCSGALRSKGTDLRPGSYFAELWASVMSMNSCDYFKASSWLQPGSSYIITLWDLSKKIASWKILVLQCATFLLEAEKGNFKFPPQHLSLTLMSCLPWNSISPGAKITDIPPRCHGRQRSRCQPEEGAKKAMLMFGVFLNRFCVMQDELHTLFCCHHRGCCCGSPWQGRHQRWLYPQKTEFKCPEHHWKVRQTRGFEFEYTGSLTDTCCIWITAG